MKPITRTHSDEVPGPFYPDPTRPIAIGNKYRQNPGTAYCFIGCEQCDRHTGKRCWRRRAEMSMVYRIRALTHTDWKLGRAFLVSLVRPDQWQIRAFSNNSSVPRERWHEVTGLVWEAELGEQIL